MFSLRQATEKLFEVIPSKLDNATSQMPDLKVELRFSLRGKRQPISFVLRTRFLGRSRQRAVAESPAPLRACLFDSSVSLERR